MGTDTEVGKTWVSVALAGLLVERGRVVVAAKPVQSFDPTDVTTDAALLAAATDQDEFDVCPEHRRYAIAMAPPMAADVLGRPEILFEELLSEVMAGAPDPDSGAVHLIETVGGLRSPMAHDADAQDLVDRMQPDLVVLVADAGLGSLNRVLLTADGLEGHDIVVFLNRFDSNDELHRGNERWLLDRAKLDVATSIASVADRLVAPETSTRSRT